MLSAAFSIAVIAVAIPRSTRDKPQQAASPTIAPHSQALTKAGREVSHAIVRVGKTAAPGVALSVDGRSVLVSSAARVPDNQDATVAVVTDTGAQGEATVLFRDAESGVVILSAPNVVDSLLNGGFASGMRLTDDVKELLVFDPASQLMEAVRLGIALESGLALVPLEVTHSIPGATAVSTVGGEFVGIAVERNDTTWLIPAAVVGELANRAFAARTTAGK